MKNLESIGFDEWVEARIDTNKLEDHDVARVISTHKDSYVVTNQGCLNLKKLLNF